MEPTLAREAELGLRGTTALLVGAAAPRADRGAPSQRRLPGRALRAATRVNVGVTIARGRLRGRRPCSTPNEKSAVEIATELSDLYQRAREGTLTPAELSGADVHRDRLGRVRHRDADAADRRPTGGRARRRADPRRAGRPRRRTSSPVRRWC